MTAIKRILILAAVAVGCATASAPSADAGIVFRGGPVRRVAARAALPPYPVARRAAYGPVYRPYARPYYRGYFAAPVVYGPVVSVAVGL